MQWNTLVNAFCVDCKLEPPASEAAIAEVEVALSVHPPDQLRTLWQEANGITDNYYLTIWSVETTIQQNRELRSNPELNDLYMAFTCLLFFAEEGNGDLFFFPIQANGKINRPDIFVWKHENDNREWVAADLERFIEMSARKKIS